MSERVRKLQFQRPLQAASQDSTRLMDAIETFMRQALPEWAQGSVLLEPQTFTIIPAATTLYIAHNLGRKHKGWFFISPMTTAPVAWEITSGTDYRAAFANTHVQITPGADFTAALVVF